MVRSELEAQSESLKELVKQFVPDSTCNYKEGKEICYSLPPNSASEFKELFQNLEKDSQLLGIEHFGISMTTLEEIYLKLSKLIQFKIV